MEDLPLKIADIGCGGCADHPTLEIKIERVLKKYGIHEPKLEIVGMDINEEMLNSVIIGNFEYTGENEDVPESEREYIDYIIENCFEKNVIVLG